jgi:hypothetical protein
MVRKIKDTIRILKDYRTQGYMQVSITPKNLEVSGKENA